MSTVKRKDLVVSDWRDRVAAATVQVLNNCPYEEKFSQGVLISGGFILTAAHCITRDINNTSQPPICIVNRFRRLFEMRILGAPEPETDIAVLIPFRDSLPWSDISVHRRGRQVRMTQSLIAPIDISPMLGKGQSLPVHILTRHEVEGVDTWISGKVTVEAGRSARNPYGRVRLESDHPIEVSGGPVVDASGRILGVISYPREQAPLGMAPFAPLILPSLDWSIISQEQEE